MTKKWSKPTLTVLCKSTPEEQVLCVCKSGNGTHAGPEHNTCHVRPNEKGYGGWIECKTMNCS